MFSSHPAQLGDQYHFILIRMEIYAVKINKRRLNLGVLGTLEGERINESLPSE